MNDAEVKIVQTGNRRLVVDIDTDSSFHGYAIELKRIGNQCILGSLVLI